MKSLLASILLASSLSAQSAVVQHDVNLRRDASIAEAPITLLTPPERLRLLEKIPQGGFLHVRTATAQEGWVWAKNVVVSDAPPPAGGFAGPAEIYPDPAKTPGVTNPDVTQANLSATICNPSFSTDSIRPPTSVTDPLKVMQLAAYGDTISDPGATCMLHSDNKACYEEDHLISLENGGHPRDPGNLWPEAYFTRIDGNVVGARQKDVVENYVRNATCFGFPGYQSHGIAAHASISLKQGQDILTGDWYACYLKIKSGADCN